MDQEPTQIQKPRKTASEILHEADDTIKKLADTQPIVPITYPERHASNIYGPANPVFIARGIELDNPEVRQKGFNAFKDAGSLSTEAHLIIRGERNGEPVTLVLKRDIVNDNIHPYKKDPNDEEITRISAHETPFGHPVFETRDMKLSEDGQTLEFTAEFARKGGEYEDLSEMRVDGMYLTQIERRRNSDQIKAGRFTRAFHKMRGPVKGFTLS